jgi:hypothetical protein
LPERLGPTPLLRYRSKVEFEVIALAGASNPGEGAGSL